MQTESRTLITEQGPYQIWVEEGISPFIVNFLKTVRLGTDGAVYRHYDTEDRIAHIEQPYTAYATEGEKFVACMVMSRIETWQGDQPLDSYYIRYFSAHPDYRGKGITKEMSLLFIDAFVKTLPQGTLLYGVLEGGNSRSIKIVEKVGFEDRKPVRTIGFSRFFPKGSKRIERITTEAEREEVLNLLEDFYADYAIRHFQNVFQKDRYYVIREKGEILAGLQVHKTVWKVESMPGLSGKIMLNVLPRLPLVNKMFNPRHFEFITFEGIYYKSGEEAALYELIEGLLAQEKLKSAVFWLAEDAPLAKMILERGKLGLIHRFVKDAGTFIAYNTTNLSEEQLEQLLRYPPYISSFDFI
ncbi:MAG TPA: GNAT family N-acetyltransferase [Saprospiraceae bacterium]|nr:GNAT family N-acetyltransferase [Saprospiraceae bacterium]